MARRSRIGGEGCRGGRDYSNQAETRTGWDDAGPGQPVNLIYADGSRRYEPLSADGHVALYSRAVHFGQRGLVEVAVGSRQADGTLRMRKRRDRRNYIAAGDQDALIDHVRQSRERGDEVFSSPLARKEPEPGKAQVKEGYVVWVDVDDVEDEADLSWVDILRPHLWIASGGGLHAYWRLARALSGEEVESCNRRLAHRLGGDMASCDRGRIMRLPGTVNGKHKRWCRIIRLDLVRPAVNPDRLREKLPDPEPPPVSPTPEQLRRRRAYLAADDAAKVAPPDYFPQIAGVNPPERGGLIRCPLPDHEERLASCMVYGTPERGWWCFGCTRGGGVYDLGSLMEGGSWGRALYGDEFLAVKRRVHELLGLGPTDSSGRRS